MATINGNIQKRLTLTPNVESVIAFSGNPRFLELTVSGGTVLFKPNGSISGVNDLTANTVEDSYEGFETGSIDTLHLLSTVAAVVQWHVN